MAKQKRKSLVPKLRFPEFRADDDWEEEALSEYIKQYSRKVTAKTNLPVYSSTREGLKPQEEYYNGRIVINTSEYGVTPVGFFVYRHMSDDDKFHFNINETSGEIAVSKEYPVFQTVGMDSYFLLMLLNHSPGFKRFCRAQKKGGTRTRLYLSSLGTWKTYIPALSEQEKIADCLSSLDDLIATHSAKLDALQDHKTGLLQQLFPAEGEAVPELRFSEFRGMPKWEKTTIGDIGNFYYGKSAPKWSLAKDAPTKCVRYGELYSKFGTVIDETYSRTKIDPSNLRFSKGGEILVPRVGEKPEDFGKCCCYLPLENIAIGEMISVFETQQNPLFYTHYFRRLYKKIAKVVEGQNVKNLYYSELEPLQIYRPSPQEQKKVADCLTSLDSLIFNSSEEISRLRSHKKGLIQQLFPNSGGVGT